MKPIFSLLVLFFPFLNLAQEPGVRFESSLSWKEVKAKAKAESKYIFLDCVTTWCKPCKWMADSLFPKKEAGDFFNRYFINVKMQVDRSAKDSEDTKKWYEDAKAIATEYFLPSFPTFLYFSPDGKLVHKSVGGEIDVDAFIRIASAALDSSRQYYTLLEKVEGDPKADPRLLRYIAFIADEIREPQIAEIYSRRYLASQLNWFTKENIAFIEKFTTSSKDTAFKVLLHYPGKIDKVMGKGTAAKYVRKIIMQEEITPLTLKAFNTGVPTDWKTLEKKLIQKYPKHGAEALREYNAIYRGIK